MSERASIIPPSTVRFERLLPGPVERVWAYLVESDKRATWLAAGEFDLRLGGRIELHFENDKLSDDVPPPDVRAGGVRLCEGVITRLEPLRALAHTWVWDGKASEVVYELTPQASGVLLTICHTLPDDRGLKIAVAGGWVVHSGILEDQLNGVKARPFYATHAQLMQEHAAVV